MHSRELHSRALLCECFLSETRGYGKGLHAGRMRIARGYGGAAVVGRSVFVAGGGDGSSWLRSAERYDLSVQRWDSVRVGTALLCLHALRRCKEPAGFLIVLALPVRALCVPWTVVGPHSVSEGR